MMLLLHRKKMVYVGQVIALLELFLLLSSCVIYTKSTGCRFPDFLQSSDEGMGNWTCKYGEGTILHMEVMGGQYLVRQSKIIHKHYRERDSQMVTTESVVTKKRRCVQKVGENKFIVEQVQPTLSYQCMQFIKRSPTVVQLKISATYTNWTNICHHYSANMSLEQYPWISLKGYRHAVSSCPFTGGLHFHDVSYFNKDHKRLHHCPRADPVRLESDCVENDGIHIQFGEDHCVKKHLRSGHFLCMATWYDEEVGDGFALLRNANGDRHFYCLRIIFENMEVARIYLYLDWLCYRAHEFQASFSLRLSYATSYLTFSKPKKKVVSYHCKVDDSSVGRDCESDTCLNTTCTSCEFFDDVIGDWQIQEADRDPRTFEIIKDGMNHPSLGQLKCVSFNDKMEVRLRAILAGNFQNGCFPRFLCMDFETPNQSVMRYRMGDVHAWPLPLSDESVEICHEDNFQVPPDITNPTDIFHPKPPMVALRSSHRVPTMPCVLPGYIPRHNSFVSHDNRTGCINLRPDFAPSTVSITFFQDGFNFIHPPRKPILSVEKFDCVAALSYTSIVTLTSGRQSEFLCWVVVDRETIVVIKTSACNEWTARRIVHGNKKYTPDMTYSLKLGVAGKEVSDTCGNYYKEEHDAWVTGNENYRVERQKFGDRGGSSGTITRCSFAHISCYALLNVLLVLLVCGKRFIVFDLTLLLR